MRLCVAVSGLNYRGPVPAFSCAGLDPAPTAYAVYFLLCGKWMSLPWLKCWCAAKFSSFGLARSEEQRTQQARMLLNPVVCHAPWSGSWLDVLRCAASPAFRDAQCPHIEAFEGICEVEKRHAVLKRVWSWITRRHKLASQPCTVPIPRGRSRQRAGMEGAGISLLGPSKAASGRECADAFQVQLLALMCPTA